MSMLILCVGKARDPELSDAIAAYEKRLRAPYDVSWRFLPHAPQADAGSARDDESRRLLAVLAPDDIVILLDERGRLLGSPDLSRTLGDLAARGRRIVFIIGGAYGVTEAVMSRADLVWALSPLVFPHRLVRLILIEQLYRSQAIAAGLPYHHA